MTQMRWVIVRLVRDELRALSEFRGLDNESGV